MAADKTNNLSIFLKDIADQIRANDGTTANINPQDFRTKISNTVGANVTKPAGLASTTDTNSATALTAGTKYKLPAGYYASAKYYSTPASAANAVFADGITVGSSNMYVQLVKTEGIVKTNQYMTVLDIPEDKAIDIYYNGISSGDNQVNVYATGNGSYNDYLRIEDSNGAGIYPFRPQGEFDEVGFSASGSTAWPGYTNLGTFTPGTRTMTIYKTTGISITNETITISGDTNLTADNIKKGQTIFGVTGANTNPDWESVTLPANCRYLTIKNNASSGTVRYNYYSSASAVYAGTTINAGAVSGSLTVLSSTTAGYGYLVVQVPSNAAAAGITISFSSSNNGSALFTKTLTGSLLYTFRVSSSSYGSSRTLYINKISG